MLPKVSIQAVAKNPVLYISIWSLKVTSSVNSLVEGRFECVYVRLNVRRAASANDMCDKMLKIN